MQRLVLRNLRQQLVQHRCIANGVVRDLDGTDLQGLSIDAQVHLAPLPAIVGPVLLRVPLAFAQHFHAGAVDQQVQPRAAAARCDGHTQRLLAPRQGAVVGHAPVQPGQLDQALGQAHCLTKAQPKHALQCQAELDRSVAEHSRATWPTTGRSLPLEVGIEPDHQRSSALERLVVLTPIRRAVLCPWWLAHPPSLPKFTPRTRPSEGVWQQRLHCPQRQEQIQGVRADTRPQALGQLPHRRCRCLCGCA